MATDTLRTGWAPPARSRSALLRRGQAFLKDLTGTGKRFWVLVVLTGATAGFAAVFLVWFLRFCEQAAWPAAATFLDAVERASPLRRATVPAIAGLVVTLAAVITRKPMSGHGTAGILESIWIKSGRMALVRTLFRGVVSIFAVALGAPLGREGALLQFGAATGSSLGARLKVSADQARLLVACGASAGIAAAYNVPIGASLFGLEVLLGSLALDLFGPIVVACVTATLISRILIADHPSYVIPHHALLRPKELLLDLAVGPLLGVASALYNRTIRSFAVWMERVPRRLFTWLPLASMALVGVAAIDLPQIMGNGYDAVDQALLGQMSWRILLILPMAKMLFTALTSACGVPGGLFTPSLFYGAMLGGLLGHVAQHILPGAAAPGAYALIGMCAILAATTHASVSAVLIIFELTGSYEVILPLMLTSVLATAVSRTLEPESIYTAVLKRRNVQIPHSPRSPFRSTPLRALLSPSVEVVPPETSFEEVVVRMLELPPGVDLYVTTDQGKLLGVIILDELKGHIPDHTLLRMTVAADVMDTSVVPVPVEASLSEVAARFAETELERLPITDKQGRLLGVVSKREVLRHGKF